VTRDQKARGAAARQSSRDGRTLRSERSREAIAAALFDLVGEGNPEPTAQQVSERAGVGIRSVFRHFSDIEALYATLDARLLAELRPILRETPPEVDLRGRAAALVKRRAALFERIASYKRASNLKRWRSPFLRSQHAKLVAEMRADLLQWLPELAEAPPAVLEALDQATSFEAWDRLRSEQRLGRVRAAEAMRCAALALIRGLGAGPGSLGP
jgi:AcrR family transcriptional regulator